MTTLNKINSWSVDFFSIDYDKKSDTCSHKNQTLVNGKSNVKGQYRQVITCQDCDTTRILLKKVGK